ncbi:MAG: TorF family putative porin [Alphaproteobacteria bacterium]|nr:TorF family putative porin [Alphaproteobacteria bacterium]
MRLKALVFLTICLIPTYTNAAVEAGSSFIGKSDSVKKESTNKYFDLYGNVGFFTNYSYRGISESLNTGVIQGELKISQERDEGFYAGLWGSNIDAATAPNGSSLELSPYVGYAHQFNKDLSVNFRVQGLYYPGCYASNEHRDTFNMLEFVPAFAYKWFSMFVAVQPTNVTGLTPFLANDIAERDPTRGRENPPNTKWSYYTEASLTIPVPCTEERLKFKLTAGYWKIRNYSFLSYARYMAGVTYLTPKSFGELLLSANAETTSAKDLFWTNTNEAGKQFRLGKNKFWVGIAKEF